MTNTRAIPRDLCGHSILTSMCIAHARSARSDARTPPHQPLTRPKLQTHENGCIKRAWTASTTPDPIPIPIPIPFCKSFFSSLVRKVRGKAMATRGEANDYYNNNSAPPPPQQQGYDSNGYQMNEQLKYAPQQQQQPPQYEQSYAPPPQGPPPPAEQGYGNGQQGYGQNYAGGEKPTFEQAFKIPKPKYNDLWAGALFIAVFLGYVAVSGIVIQGYCEFGAVFLLQSIVGLCWVVTDVLTQQKPSRSMAAASTAARITLASRRIRLCSLLLCWSLRLC